MIRTNIHLAPDQRERLAALARKRGVSVAEVVRRAVERELDREDARVRMDASIVRAASTQARMMRCMNALLNRTAERPGADGESEGEG